SSVVNGVGACMSRQRDQEKSNDFRLMSHRRDGWAAQPWVQGQALRSAAVGRISRGMTDLISTRPSGLQPPRRYDGVNWVGLRTLYLREVRRFWKVGAQTVAAPVVTTLLYMLVFVVALKGSRPPIAGTPFAEFVAPGLIMMAILNNAFANASSSLIQAKIMGTATDFLTPPLSPLELTIGFSMGAATRGVV